MLASRLNHLVHDNKLSQYSIVKAKKFTFSQMRTDKKIVIILDLEIVTPGDEVGAKIGIPVGHVGSDGAITNVNYKNITLNIGARALVLKRPGAITLVLKRPSSTPLDGSTENKLPTPLPLPRRFLYEMFDFLSAQIRDIEKGLECPGCLEVCTFAPIFTCEEFHLLCASCRRKMVLCPQCRRELKKPAKRHRFAEKIVENVKELYHQRNKLLVELAQIKKRQLQDKIIRQVTVSGAGFG